MSVYHQMGHDTINLVKEEHLMKFKGAILSPVNYTEDEIVKQVEYMRKKENFEAIFDPQLYYPRTERKKLKDWSYFPSDVDTADITNEYWWHNVTDEVVKICKKINCHSACSPAFAPRSYTDDYYSLIVRVGNYFVEKVKNDSIEPIQTILVGLNDLSSISRSKHIASIISQTLANRVYLIFVSDIEPRRELNNANELKSAMKLIQSLEKAELEVIVGCCSTEFILWKAAGASSCATGKFFNLRRFTSSRFEEPKKGGGQLPYWFEENLLAFLRDSDLIRIKRNNLLNPVYESNPYAIKILEQMEKSPESAWLALSWRQYMYAFSDLENRIENGLINIEQLLKQAEDNWINLNNNNILMEEMTNNGSWVRIWRIALTEFKKN